MRTMECSTRALLVVPVVLAAAGVSGCKTPSERYIAPGIVDIRTLLWACPAGCRTVAHAAARCNVPMRWEPLPAALRPSTSLYQLRRYVGRDSGWSADGRQRNTGAGQQTCDHLGRSGAALANVLGHRIGQSEKARRISASSVGTSREKAPRVHVLWHCSPSSAFEASARCSIHLRVHDAAPNRGSACTCRSTEASYRRMPAPTVNPTNPRSSPIPVSSKRISPIPAQY